MSKGRILAVDDDVRIQRFLRATFQAEGYDVLLAGNGEEAVKLAELHQPDLVLLDIAMPLMNGMHACNLIREWSQVPIVVVSGQESMDVKIECYRLGVDDYLMKPFNAEELQAKVRAVLRRSKRSEFVPEEPTFSRGDLFIRFPERSVTVEGKHVETTRIEFNLLKELVVNRGRVLTHEMLLNRVWGPEYTNMQGYVRVFVNRIRQKLKDNPTNPKYIRTVTGVGYAFTEA